jgi:hypothetical protein
VTGAEALSALEARGARVLLLPSGALDVTAPAGPETEVLLDELAAHKPEAVVVLRSRENVVPLSPDRPRRAVPTEASCCPTCQGTDFWISLAMVRICERCHPPASEKIVAQRGKSPATSLQAARSPEDPAPAIPSPGGRP